LTLFFSSEAWVSAIRILSFRRAQVPGGFAGRRAPHRGVQNDYRVCAGFVRRKGR